MCMYICENLIVKINLWYTLYTGHDGEFCQNDADGCDIISCLEGQQCYDYPAPLVGAVCSCPDGYAVSSDSKCVGKLVIRNVVHTYVHV